MKVLRSKIETFLVDLRKYVPFRNLSPFKIITFQRIDPNDKPKELLADLL